MNRPKAIPITGLIAPIIQSRRLSVPAKTANDWTRVSMLTMLPRPPAVPMAMISHGETLKM